MKKFVYFSLLSLAVCSDACAIKGSNALPHDVESFMALLTAQQTPTLADYLAYYGPNAEDEIMVLLKYCKAEKITHDDCVSINNSESESPREHASRYFSWIRNCYKTIGHDWSVEDEHKIQDKESQIGVIYDVRMNGNTFKIQYVLPRYRYDGLAVAIFQINGKDTKELIESASNCTQSSPMRP